MKEDGTEIGRTCDAKITATDANAGLNTEKYFTVGNVSWEYQDTQFEVTMSPQKGGGLPLQLIVELWAIYDMKDARNILSDKSDTKKMMEPPCVQLLATAVIGPDTLLLPTPGRLTLPLVLSALSTEPSSNIAASLGSAGTLRASLGKETPTKVDSMRRPPEIVLRVTPQVGMHWGYRAIAAARAAKRARLPIPPKVPSSIEKKLAVELSGEDKAALVIYMTNAEGSARTWHAPVTPGDSISRKAYEDILELAYASIPACCPQAPALVVAPFSDIGVKIGSIWIGPPVAARHAIVAHRPVYAPGDGRNGKDQTSVAIEPPREDELFLRTVSAEAESLLRELRSKDMRVEQRRLALMRVQEICDRWGRTCSELSIKATNMVEDIPQCINDEEIKGVTTDNGDGEELSDYSGDESEGESDDEDHAAGRIYGDLYRGFLTSLDVALPGVSVYIGLLKNGGQTIRYVACSRSSSMAGKELKRGEGISFSCVGARYQPFVFYPQHKSRCPSEHRQTEHQHSLGEDWSAPTQKITNYHPNRDFPATQDILPDGKHGDVSQNTKVTDSVGKTVVEEGKTGSVLTGKPAPHVEPSPEDGAVSIQKTFRRKLAGDRLIRIKQHSPHTGGIAQRQADAKTLPLRRKQNTRTIATLSTSVPKVFDYEGRVGWPFVCVPLEGLLGASSIGVVGMDNFEQMGSNRRDSEQPEAGVVQMVAESAR